MRKFWRRGKTTALFSVKVNMFKISLFSDDGNPIALQSVILQQVFLFVFVDDDDRAEGATSACGLSIVHDERDDKNKDLSPVHTCIYKNKTREQIQLL